jgi:hypothetical protein
MPKYAAKVDRNQSEIVDALRKCGATVETTHTAGEGFPDICVGYRGKTYLIEIKDGLLPPSARTLTTPQKKWHAGWKGHVCIATSVDEALAAVGCGVVSVPLLGTIT